MRRPGRLGRSFVAVAATLAVCAAAPALAMHASGAADPWSIQAGPGVAYFSLGASLGYVAGTGTELVYQKSNGSRVKLSELKWDFNDVVLAGVQASAGFGARYRVNAGYWSAVSEGTGMMVDRDWIYEQPVTGALVPGDDNWTHESHHPDTTLDGGGILDLNLNVLALRSGPLSLRGVLGYKNDVWSWSARGGTYVYSNQEFRDTVGSFVSGRQVIEYEQAYRIPYLGVGVNWSTPSFLVDGHLLVSPLVFATETDYHNLRVMIFEGEYFGGTYVGLGLTAALTFGQRWSLTMHAEYQSISGLSGDMTVSGPNGRRVYEDSSGIGMHATMISLGASVRF